jgi:propionate CoA-transferase
MLCEVAPGIELERDILAQMGFRPRLADPIRQMNPRIFTQASMDLAATV